MKKTTTRLLFAWAFCLLFGIGSLKGSTTDFSPPCSVSFTWNALEGGMVNFEAQAQGGTAPYEIIWDFGDGTGGSGSFVDHAYMNNGYYEVTATLTDQANCQSVFSADIIVENYNPCYYTDCVFPGDVNGDQQANIYDVLPIGIHYWTTGPARMDASDEWDGQECSNWGDSYMQGVDLKHLDCNGDGIIDKYDLDAIDLNFQMEHNGLEPLSSSLYDPPFYLEFDDDTIIVNPNNPGLVQISAKMMLGSPNIPVTDFYGMAYSLSFDSELILPGSVVISHDPESFIGSPSDLISLGKESEPGFFDAAVSKINQQPVSGWGSVARVDFTIIGDIVVNRSEDQDIPMLLSPSGITVVRPNGSIIPVSDHPTEIILKLDDDVAVQEPGAYPSMKLSPNPAKDNLSLEFGEMLEYDYKVLDVSGKDIKAGSGRGSFLDLDVSDLNTGVYFIEITGRKGLEVRKFLIQ